MDPVALQAVAVASGGLLSPGSALIVLTLLSTPGGLARASSYAVGYTTGYAIIGCLFLAVGQLLHFDGMGEGGSFIGPVVSLILGMLLLGLAVRSLLKSESSSGLPRLFSALDKLSSRRAVGLGLLVAMINFKNLAIFLSAVAIIAEGGLSWAMSLATLSTVVVVFCAAVVIPVVLSALLADAVQARLLRVRGLLERHNRPISICVMLLLGSLLSLRGAKGLFDLMGM